MNKTLSQFHTRSASNDGIDLPLVLPSGEDSGFSIKIRGSHSDAFKRASAQSRREAVKASAGSRDSDSALYDKLEDSRLTLLSALVVSWDIIDDDGVPYPCTRANIIDLLTEAPQIADEIDTMSSKTELFTSPSKTSSTGPKTSSPKTKGPKDPK